ncbi:hypothetical protein [Mesorhizobium sp.]|uniref:hypothetical protein n=1 Tax=Mesorhizobium sp. TaxID=1871066 RepID=UPI0025F793F9|nr:hypothetical protein [Mesorhizobium sp.]
MAGTFSAEAADKFPPIWRKSMTNDPGTNYFLNKYSASLNDPASTAIRNIMLARVVGSELPVIAAQQGQGQGLSR